MNVVPLLLITHFAATAYMTGVIWVVQLIQYRWIDSVPGDHFPAHHVRYNNVMGFVVGPAMLIELATGLLLAAMIDGPGRTLFLLSIVLLAVIWASTFLIQVPCHMKLHHGYDHAIHHRLLHTNWIRTAGWTTRLLLIGSIMLMNGGIGGS